MLLLTGHCLAVISVHFCVLIRGFSYLLKRSICFLLSELNWRQISIVSLTSDNMVCRRHHNECELMLAQSQTSILLTGIRCVIYRSQESVVSKHFTYHTQVSIRCVLLIVSPRMHLQPSVLSLLSTEQLSPLVLLHHH